MNLITKYHIKQTQYWVDITQYFNNLSPLLHKQGKLLQNNLAFFYSDNAQFQDILSLPHYYPWRHLHFWLLDDWGEGTNKQQQDIEKHVFLGMLFSFMAIYTQEAILDEGTFFDNNYNLLNHSLSQQTVFQFAQIFPKQSSFWNYYWSFWNDYSEAILWEFEPHLKENIPIIAEDILHTSNRLAPAKVAATAIAIKMGKEHKLPKLLSLIKHLNLIFYIKDSILTVRRDLMRGNYSYPIVKTMLLARISLQKPYIPEQVLGAMLLTNSIKQVCETCLTYLEVCDSLAQELDLPTFKTYFPTVQSTITQIQNLFSMPLKSNIKQKPSKINKNTMATPLFASATNPIEKAIEMAEGYLLSDLTFKESWELHRRGMFNAPEVIAKFPAGLIIEILCLNGHNMAPQINKFYQHLKKTGFSYYDHPQFPYPDTDNLAILLRLYRHSIQKENHADILKTPLKWMVDNILESGQIPVWLTKQIPLNNIKKETLSLLGDNCGTIEANLLIGLIDYAKADYWHIIQKSAINLLNRFIKNGPIDITTNYPPLYTLFVLTQLILTLSSHSTSEVLTNTLSKAKQALLTHITHQAQKRIISSQDAAFLTLTCSTSLTHTLFNPRWQTIILKNQRCDGSWYSDPFFFVPNRGELLTWYSSHTLTTAFCYYALKKQKQL